MAKVTTTLESIEKLLQDKNQTIEESLQFLQEKRDQEVKFLKMFEAQEDTADKQANIARCKSEIAKLDEYIEKLKKRLETQENKQKLIDYKRSQQERRIKEAEVLEYFIIEVKKGIEYWQGKRSYLSLFKALRSHEVMASFILDAVNEYNDDLDYEGLYIKAVNLVKREYEEDIREEKEAESYKQKRRSERTKNALFYTGTLLAIDRWLTRRERRRY